METIANSKIFRLWTYFIMLLLCLFALIWKSNEIMAGMADLVRALDGR